MTQPSSMATGILKQDGYPFRENTIQRIMHRMNLQCRINIIDKISTEEKKLLSRIMYCIEISRQRDHKKRYSQIVHIFLGWETNYHL